MSVNGPSLDILARSYRGVGSFARRPWVRIVCGLAAFTLVMWWSWIPKQREKHAAPPVRAFGTLPLSFETNHGQAATDVDFVGRGAGYSLLLTKRGEPVLLLQGRGRTAQKRSAQNGASAASKSRRIAGLVTLRLSFANSNASPTVEGRDALASRSHYLIGNDPTKWLTDVPHFARVLYREIYPGIDVLYYAQGQQLEYDFLVKPGADPRRIRFSVDGADKIEVGQFGDLVVQTRQGRVLLHKPIAYQTGLSGEHKIQASYLLHDNGEAGFELAGYDATKPLRIDPVLSYAAQFDGTARAVALDATGNIYLAGTTFSSNFTTTPGAAQGAFGGNSDGFIAKLDPTGSTLLFATYLGGSDFDSISGIALDGSNNIHVTGSTASPNFPTGNAFQSALGGNTDGFITKLNAAGSQILYSSYFGGALFDSANDIALNSAGHTFVTGHTESGNFPTTVGAFDTMFGGSIDAFVAKFDTTMSGAASRLYSTYLGAGGFDIAEGLAVDSSGNAYVTGQTDSANFPTVTPIQPLAGNADAFVTKLDAAGSALIYSTFLGGSNTDIGSDIALDASNNTYVVGSTFSTNFTTTAGSLQPTYNGNGDAFITKLNAAGSARVYSSYIGGSQYDVAYGIALDNAGNAFLTGATSSSNFPVVNPVQAAQSGGTCSYYYYYYFYPCSDAIVPQVSASGSALIYSTYLGGANMSDAGSGIAVDSNGIAYVVGTAGPSFPFTPGALLMSNGSGGFAAKISPQSMPGFSFGTGALAFPPTLNGSSSMQTVVIQNVGSATLNITSILTTGNFTASQNCLPSMAGGSSCPVTVTFSPTAVTSFTGTLTVVDSAAGSPHTLPLSGNGVNASTTSVTSSPNPSTLGQQVTLTATVSPASATGVVSFLDGGIVIGTGTLSSGTATFSTSALTAGSHSIAAAYQGDANFAASTSATLTQTVNKLLSTTTLSSMPNPSNSGQAVTFTASVTPATATGTVTFMNGAAFLGTVSLNAGTATLMNTSLPVGNNSITANYAGDATFASSTSAPLTQGVNGIGLSPSSTTATVSSGGTANFTLTVNQNGLSAPITFSCSGLPTGGSCTFSPASVPVGSGPTSVALAINVGNSFAAIPPISAPSLHPLSQFAIALLVLITLGALVIQRDQRIKLLRTGSLLIVLIALVAVAGCGGGGNSAPRQPVTLIVTANATSGAASSSTTFTITVQR